MLQYVAICMTTQSICIEEWNPVFVHTFACVCVCMCVSGFEALGFWYLMNTYYHMFAVTHSYVYWNVL